GQIRVAVSGSRVAMGACKLEQPGHLQVLKSSSVRLAGVPAQHRSQSSAVAIAALAKKFPGCPGGPEIALAADHVLPTPVLVGAWSENAPDRPLHELEVTTPLEPISASEDDRESFRGTRSELREERKHFRSRQWTAAVEYGDQLSGEQSAMGSGPEPDEVDLRDPLSRRELLYPRLQRDSISASTGQHQNSLPARRREQLRRELFHDMPTAPPGKIADSADHVGSGGRLHGAISPARRRSREPKRGTGAATAWGAAPRAWLQGACARPHLPAHAQRTVAPDCPARLLPPSATGAAHPSRP